jgi:PKD domain/BNR repeat-like domain
MRNETRIAALAAGLTAAVIQPAFASTPASHDVAIPAAAGVTTYDWTGTVLPGAFGGANTCVNAPSSDGHALNVTVPADLYDDFKVKADFHIEWADDAQDLVLSVERNGTNIGDSDGGTPEENVSTNNPTTATFTTLACPFASTAPTAYSGRLTITVTPKITSPDLDNDGVLNEVDVCPGTPAGTAVDAQGCPLPTAAGLPPRFQIHVAPAGLGDDAGEPSIGFNKFSQHTMFIAYTQALRQTYQEDVVPPLLPASCPATWEDKSGTLTQINSLDPILFTDEATGRTWNSQLSGDNSLMEYTDDDGENWTPAQQGPPNGGADHQTVASGVYPAGAEPPTALWPATGPKRAVYYCSQSVATAFCSRSDDGGQTFGPGNNFKNLDCAAGALHGHVKVAPDGTVYVPDSSQCIQPLGGTADQVIAFRSDNAGVTWSVKNIPSSVGGAASDPSIGIATNGTLYMCYENSDSSVHMVVSHDKGDTWVNDVDVGAAHGIVQTRFPQAVAGDGDRAACAFLGTTTPGNGSSLAFEGVWHGYIATTYDAGATYHVENVTPLDPVQGYGGICGSGTCRNLLDFNDLQIDDEGRLLFGFADGCLGPCVTDPSKNTFEDKATIVRQTGGRTLFAAFDGARFNVTTPLIPAEACARQDLSSRNLLQANVVWNAPDTGGETITNYKVYRAEDAAGPFTFIGDAGAALSYQDKATRPSVEKYFYKVDAQNALGTALSSNVIELPITIEGSSCELPGIFTVADAEGDSTGGVDQTDIQSVHFAEPEAFGDKLVATLKVVSLNPAPPNQMWAVRFEAPVDPANGEPGYWVGLTTIGGTNRFVHGTWRVDSAPAAASVTVYTVIGDIDAASSITPEGVITLVADKALFGGLDPGDTIAGVLARVGPATSDTIAGAAQDDTGSGSYEIQGSLICADPGVPIAELKASVNEGDGPLDVEFTLSGAHTKGKDLVSYELDLGDGSAIKSGSFTGPTARVRHSYRAEGVHRATLKVTDEVGTVSTNLAEETITIINGVPPIVGNNRLGGALPAASLLVLLGLLGIRRRRSR